MGGTFTTVAFNLSSATGVYCGNAFIKNGDVKIGVQTIMNAATKLHFEMVNGLKFGESPFAIQALKPKAEVYKRSEVYNKTRNICAMNAPCTVLPQAIITPFFKGRSPFQPEDFRMHEGAIPPGNLCLVGWSPAKGFM